MIENNKITPPKRSEMKHSMDSNNSSFQIIY